MSDLYNPNKKEPGGPAPADTTGAGPDAAPGLRAVEPLSPAPESPPAGDGGPAGRPPAQAATGAGEVPVSVPVPDAVQASDPERIPSGGPDADRVRIGLWGAPRAGKTTYLAALPIAAMQHERHHQGSWNISGMTQEANAFLGHGIDLLTRQRTFPQASMGVQGLAWSVQGPKEKGMLGFRARRPSFVLDIQDAAGEVFRHDNPQQAQLVGQLARSQGLIYLFDPLGDAQEGTESFTYLQSTLTQLAARVRDRDGLVDGRLPHHVSVCIAKFDHPDVFRPAVEAGWVTQDTEGAQLPHVPGEQSEKFFQWMCDDFRGSNARLVRDALHAYFDRRRISYYATSAIGFRLNPQQVFDYKDYVQPVEVDGTPHLRTSPVPINVLEPLIDLERRIHQDRSRERSRDRGRGGWRGVKRR
ncbi:hypothetical protein ACWHA1_18970 [Streptomyces decoyicus]